jgi:hypothetical protein
MPCMKEMAECALLTEHIGLWLQPAADWAQHKLYDSFEMSFTCLL